MLTEQQRKDPEGFAKQLSRACHKAVTVVQCPDHYLHDPALGCPIRDCERLCCSVRWREWLEVITKAIEEGR